MEISRDSSFFYDLYICILEMKKTFAHKYVSKSFINFGLVATKPFFRVSDLSKTLTSLLSNRDYLEIWNSPCSKFRYANDKGADQSALMPSLVCAFVVSKPRRHVFLH